jgi:release factor glutamine methyltransferase
VTARFDAIVANPPYIAEHDQHLEALTHEPAQALVSGPDGLDDIRTIIAQAQNHLHPGGWLLLEHGFDQASQVRDELRQAGFMNAQSRCDLSGIERCSGAMHAPV